MGVSSGAFVPVTPGQFRNDWLPKGIADYVPHTQLRELRLQNVSIERNYTFMAQEDIEREVPPLSALVEEATQVAPAAPAMKLEHLSVCYACFSRPATI